MAKKIILGVGESQQELDLLEVLVNTALNGSSEGIFRHYLLNVKSAKIELKKSLDDPRTRPTIVISGTLDGEWQDVNQMVADRKIPYILYSFDSSAVRGARKLLRIPAYVKPDEAREAAEYIRNILNLNLKSQGLKS